MNTKTDHTESLAVRRLNGADAPAARRLAGRDSAGVPSGELLGAEIDGELIAVLSLSSGAVIADPFLASAQAVEMLELRAGQLKGESKPKNGRRIRIPKLPRARGALAGSVPGSSRLLQL